jgi:hypothetical protein
MPGGGAGAGPADALAGRGEVKHHVDAGLAGVGVIAGEDIDGINPGYRARHKIGLAALAGFLGRDVAGDHDRRFQCGERFVVGMLVAPPVAMLGLAFGDAIGGLCHGNERQLGRGQGPATAHAAATAFCHCAAASALKIRSVDREIRWR